MAFCIYQTWKDQFSFHKQEKHSIKLNKKINTLSLLWYTKLGNASLFDLDVNFFFIYGNEYVFPAFSFIITPTAKLCGVCFFFNLCKYLFALDSDQTMRLLLKVLEMKMKTITENKIKKKQFLITNQYNACIYFCTVTT